MEIKQIMRDVPPGTWDNGVARSLPLQGYVKVLAVSMTTHDPASPDAGDASARADQQVCTFNPLIVYEQYVMGKATAFSLSPPRAYRLQEFLLGLLHQEAVTQGLPHSHPHREMADLSFLAVKHLRKAESDLMSSLLEVLNGEIGRDLTQPILDCFPDRQLSVYARDMLLLNTHRWPSLEEPDSGGAASKDIPPLCKVSYSVRASAGDDLASTDEIFHDIPMPAPMRHKEGKFHPLGLVMQRPLYQEDTLPIPLQLAADAYFLKVQEVHAVGLWAALVGNTLAPM